MLSLKIGDLIMICFLFFIIIISILLWYSVKVKIDKHYNKKESTNYLIILLITIAIGLVFFSFCAPSILSENYLKFGFTEKGQVGDYFGGLMNPFISIAAVIVTGLAFYVQYQANQQQKTDIEENRLESRFFELIKLYRDSVDEMNIQNVRFGRHCFIPMFKEFKCVYWLANVENKKFYSDNSKGEKIKKEALCKIAYSIFFNGIGIESNKLRRNKDENYSDFINHLENVIYSIQVQYTELIQSNSDLKTKKSLFIYFKSDGYEIRTGTRVDVLNLHKRTTNNNDEDVFIFEPKYFPFDGHITRLGHYYRNLFEIVRFIVSKENVVLEKKEVMQYLKLLRKQMSNHEQLMLYYNAVTGEGNKWEIDIKNNNANYFIDYQMIHNVPFPLADFGIPIMENYSEIINNRKGVFEWQWDDY